MFCVNANFGRSHDDDDEAVLPMNVVNGNIDLTKIGGAKAPANNNPNERSTVLSQLYASATPQPETNSSGASFDGSSLRIGASRSCLHRRLERIRPAG